tara:strand:- start:18546 stop:20714 length:2169 start_codon:yes stop_codon:yes gene_type:complete
LVAAIPASVADPKGPQVGEVWEVYGEARTVVRDISGLEYPIKDTQIDAQHATLLRPSGSQLVQWLADNIDGIGVTKAQKLYDLFVVRSDVTLYDALDAEDHEAIKSVIPSEHIRTAMFNKWLASGDAQTLRFVQERCIPLPLARKVIKFHGKQTIDKLLEDPYRLLSFTGSWSLVDGLARDKFDFALDSTKRLSAALEDALYAALDEGHTCQSLDDLYRTASKLLDPHKQPKQAFDTALLNGKAAGQFMLSGDLVDPNKTLLHATGTWLQEKSCALFIRKLISTPEQQQRLFQVDVPSVISEFEQSEQQLSGLPEFQLNSAQRKAVETSFNNRFSVITGGAGVGKTTVLKALYKLLDHLGRPRYQMALSGRATARMVEATHEPATTIAGFLKSYKYTGRELAPVVVIDEASMLDLNTFYQLSRKLPLDTHLILVGDPYQLPPIGAGLIFHLLCELSSIPSTELTVVKRQAADSGIPAAAKQIRNGIWPELTTDPSADVAFIPCPDGQILETVMSLYATDRERTQILAGVRRNPYCGIQEINNKCRSEFIRPLAKNLCVKSEDTGDFEETGFREGGLILFTANDWERNIQNGSLGQLLEVFDEPLTVTLQSTDEDGEAKSRQVAAIAKAKFDDHLQYLLPGDVDNLEHAYAITVHKSQGSQFERVIIPIRKSRILDRTFVYTAVTRAKRQVILVGDEDAAKAATEAPPKAFERQVGLRAMLIS